MPRDGGLHHLAPLPCQCHFTMPSQSSAGLLGLLHLRDRGTVFTEWILTSFSGWRCRLEDTDQRPHVGQPPQHLQGRRRACNFSVIRRCAHPPCCAAIRSTCSVCMPMRVCFVILQRQWKDKRILHPNDTLHKRHCMQMFIPSCLEHSQAWSGSCTGTTSRRRAAWILRA